MIFVAEMLFIMCSRRVVGFVIVFTVGFMHAHRS